MKISEARTAYVQAHRALLEHGISSFDGDYGERIVQAVIGGKLMPPTTKEFDIDHYEFGRVQVKTRTLLDRTSGRRSNETRAVLGRNRGFDYLAHLVLDRDLDVRDLVLVPITSIRGRIDSTKGKISIQESRSAAHAMDLTDRGIAAQKVFDARQTVIKPIE